MALTIDIFINDSDLSVDYTTVNEMEEAGLLFFYYMLDWLECCNLCFAFQYIIQVNMFILHIIWIMYSL